MEPHSPSAVEARLRRLIRIATAINRNQMAVSLREDGRRNATLTAGRERDRATFIAVARSKAQGRRDQRRSPAAPGRQP